MNQKEKHKSLLRNRTNKTLITNYLLYNPILKKNISEKEKNSLGIKNTHCNEHLNNLNKQNSNFNEKKFEKEVKKKKFTIDFKIKNQKKIKSDKSSIIFTNSTSIESSFLKEAGTGFSFNIIEIINNFSKILKDMNYAFHNIEELMKDLYNLKLNISLDSSSYISKEFINQNIIECSKLRVSNYKKIINNCTIDLEEIKQLMQKYRSPINQDHSLVNSYITEKLTNHNSMNSTLELSRKDTFFTKDTETRKEENIPEEDLFPEIDLNFILDTQDRISELPRASKCSVRKQDNFFEHMTQRRKKRFNTECVPNKFNFVNSKIDLEKGKLDFEPISDTNEDEETIRNCTIY